MSQLTYAEMVRTKNHIQHEAITNVMAELKAKHKAILNLATGAGKTRTAWKLVFEHGSYQTILFMVPKQSLIDQTIEEWAEQGIEFDYATVYTNGNIKEVAELEAFLAKPTHLKKVIFAVYNSVGVNQDHRSIFSQSDFEFDLAIYDECHRVAGKDIGLFTSCVSDEVVKAKHKLFMTATIKFYLENEKDEESLNEYSMMNEDLFGKVAYSLTVFEAIRLGILCNFETYLLEVSDQSIRRALKGQVEYYNELVKGQHLATFYGVLNAYNQGARKIITMYRKRKDAKDFARLFQFLQREIGLFKGATIASVSSDVTPAELGAPYQYYTANGNLVVIGNNKRRAQQWWLKYGPFCQSETAVATSTPWIKEGEDVPCIDCIVFGDRFKSGIDIIQIIGRALRWAEGKTIARIILPIVEGEANKVARTIQATVGSLQTDVNEYQIVYNEAQPQQSNVEPGVTIPEQSNETYTTPEAPRWVFNDDQTGITTLVTNNEMSVNLVHDSGMSETTRLEHEQMMQTIALRVSRTWNDWLVSNKADNFVKRVEHHFTDFINRYENGEVKSMRQSNAKETKEWIQEYANNNEIGINAAIEELGQERIQKIEDAVNNFWNYFSA